jgi:hypothetical protein
MRTIPAPGKKKADKLDIRLGRCRRNITENQRSKTGGDKTEGSHNAGRFLSIHGYIPVCLSSRLPNASMEYNSIVQVLLRLSSSRWTVSQCPHVTGVTEWTNRSRGAGEPCHVLHRGPAQSRPFVVTP